MSGISEIKRIRPEYTKVCRPTLIKYFGLIPAVLFVISLYFLTELSTFFYVMKIIAYIVGILFVFVVLIDFIDLLSNARIPEITDETIYDLNDQKNAYIYRVKKGGEYVQQFMHRNICKYEFDRLSKTLWVSKNIVFNMFFNVFCRVMYLAYYYLLTKIGLKTEHRIHPKAIYYHLINTSLSFYVRGNDPKVVFDNFYLVGNNRKSWQCEKTYIYKAVLTVNHSNETTEKLEIYKTEKDWNSKKPDTLKDQYQIYAFLMLFNKFVAHTNVHVSAPFICDIDEKFLPKRVQAEQAVNSVNNLVIKWEVIFIGKTWFEIVQHGTNEGRAFYNGPQPILEKKSQFYNALIAVRKDREINHMIDESIKTLNARRKARGLYQYSKEELVKRRQNLQFGIETSVLGHCCDHWVHDMFLSPIINSDYLQFSDKLGTIMGTRWTDDIISKLRSHEQPLARAVHRILEQEAPDIVEGFHWTIFQ